LVYVIFPPPPSPPPINTGIDKKISCIMEFKLIGIEEEEEKEEGQRHTLHTVEHLVEKLDREKPAMTEDGLNQITELVYDTEEIIDKESGERKRVKKPVEKRVVIDEVQKYMYSVMQRGARDENIRPFYVEETVFSKVSIHTHDIGFDPFDVVFFLSYDLHLHPTESIDLNAPDTRSHCIGMLVKYTEDMNPRDMCQMSLSLRVEDNDGNELLIEKSRKTQSKINKMSTIIQGYTMARFVNFTIREPDNWHAYAGTSFRFLRPLRNDDERFKDKIYRLVITVSEHRTDEIIHLVSYKSTPLSLFSDAKKKRKKAEVENERKRKRKKEIIVRNGSDKKKPKYSNRPIPNSRDSPRKSSSDDQESEESNHSTC
jgi:hypothetical protein